VNRTAGFHTIIVSHYEVLYLYSHFSLSFLFRDVVMAVWADVNTGFDTEEETVNFGTRTVSNNSHGVFENLTLATIRPQGEVCF
jgi:hypothetical protein